MAFYVDTNEVIEHRCKIHLSPQPLIDVCKERGLSGCLRKPPGADFVVVVIQATRSDFRSAQLEWLRRMINGKPVKRKLVEPNLFE